MKDEPITRKTAGINMLDVVDVPGFARLDAVRRIGTRGRGLTEIDACCTLEEASATGAELELAAGIALVVLSVRHAVADGAEVAAVRRLGRALQKLGLPVDELVAWRPLH